LMRPATTLGGRFQPIASLSRCSHSLSLAEAGPPGCKPGALPAELRALLSWIRCPGSVGLNPQNLPNSPTQIPKHTRNKDSQRR